MSNHIRFKKCLLLGHCRTLLCIRLVLQIIALDTRKRFSISPVRVTGQLFATQISHEGRYQQFQGTYLRPRASWAYSVCRAAAGNAHPWSSAPHEDDLNQNIRWFSIDDREFKNINRCPKQNLGVDVSSNFNSLLNKKNV